jgi:hypothetical protein
MKFQAPWLVAAIGTKVNEGFVSGGDGGNSCEIDQVTMRFLAGGRFGDRQSFVYYGGALQKRCAAFFGAPWAPGPRYGLRDDSLTTFPYENRTDRQQ